MDSSADQIISMNALSAFSNAALWKFSIWWLCKSNLECVIKKCLLYTIHCFQILQVFHTFRWDTTLNFGFCALYQPLHPLHDMIRRINFCGSIFCADTSLNFGFCALYQPLHPLHDMIRRINFCGSNFAQYGPNHCRSPRLLLPRHFQSK